MNAQIQAFRNKENIQMHESWLQHLAEAFRTPKMAQLKEFLRSQKAQEKHIFPPSPQIFAAFNTTPFEKVRVVIIGQDPYHGPGQAHGLSFSVPKGVRPPPSLHNIFKEQRRDLGINNGAHGDLTEWARQGVLLLNCVLTVESRKAASHKNQGWEEFTDAVILTLNQHPKSLVFLCWGAYAQKKARLVDHSRHKVLTSVHPSPLSAHKGFIGCGHFSKANTFLKSQKLTEINWELSL